MITDAILREAELALMDACADDSKLRLQAMTRFMRVFEDLARDIAASQGDWEAVRSWARTLVERVVAAWLALGEWELEMGELFFSALRDERDAENALYRRSQHAFAREAFRGTAVDAMLADAEDAEVDQDFHDGAIHLGLGRPSYIPASHTWWRLQDP